MGPLLDKIQGNGADSTETVNEMSEQIQESVGEMIVTIPIDYAVSDKHILVRFICFLIQRKNVIVSSRK